jgi:hypothetical protein
MKTWTISEEVMLWESANPGVVAQTVIELLGDSALTTAAWCAFAARCDGRTSDYRFWTSVFVLLRKRASG